MYSRRPEQNVKRNKMGYKKLTLLSLLLVTFLNCKVENLDTEIQQNHNVGADLVKGFGKNHFGAPFNSITHTRPNLKHCLELPKNIEPIFQKKNETLFSLRIVHNKQGLADSLDLGIGATVNLPANMGHGNARANYVKNAKFSRTTTFITVRLNVINGIYHTNENNYQGVANIGQRIRNFIKHSKDVGQVYSVRDVFMKECGDAFMTSYVAGGSFYAVIQIESTNLFSKKKLETKIKAKLKNHKDDKTTSKGRSIELSLKALKDSSSVSRKIDITSFQLGGGKAASTAPANSIQEVVQRIKDLSASLRIKKNEVPLSFTFSEYTPRLISKISGQKA